MKGLFTSKLLVLIVGLLLFGGCKNEEPVPIVKETISGKVDYILMEIVLGGVARVDFYVRDEVDGRMYIVRMAERGNFPGSTARAYIDKTDLILPNTKEVVDEQTFSTQFSVNPIVSTDNAIHVSYYNETPDSRFSTQEITGYLTPETVLSISSDEEEAIAILRTETGIQKYLKPILLDCLVNGFAKDINGAQEGDQANRFLVYKLKVDTDREY
ncbi:hypothetical protein DYBT9623_00271 [Dyadobacter sp. CECT 9623]|uniref:Uncharacterized protein n=1 Tax=Dyadobacter linearis TaxID=2823330 RepID=A0ABM8UJX3_9BACT|nr:hypothetical protein [Dyadobacter sp. CECT 9623]CAG5067550.1 hypothetical protein DYBT9623_00271 [Dyadobacter sp. CECT 9623]